MPEQHLEQLLSLVRRAYAVNRKKLGHVPPAVAPHQIAVDQNEMETGQFIGPLVADAAALLKQAAAKELTAKGIDQYGGFGCAHAALMAHKEGREVAAYLGAGNLRSDELQMPAGKVPGVAVAVSATLLEELMRVDAGCFAGHSLRKRQRQELRPEQGQEQPAKGPFA